MFTKMKYRNFVYTAVMAVNLLISTTNHNQGTCYMSFQLNLP